MYSNESQGTSIRNSLQARLAALASETGLIRIARPLWSRWLTVVSYHRIADVTGPDFDSFKPNISAGPEMFDRQMEYLDKWFNVISMEDLTEWLRDRRKLPPHAALITFDDGYLDNYTNAYPILRRRGLNASIFLATDHIGTDRPFYWDLAAYCFHHTHRDHVPFPDGRESKWRDVRELDAVSKAWIEIMKLLPETEKRTWVERLPGILGVSIPDGQFRALMMDWGQVREMSGNGIEFGGHTLNHPILTRIPRNDARAQIAGSKKRVEEEVGRHVLGFAYPNGKAAELDPDIQSLVAESGYQVAFTLMHGPLTRQDVRQEPFAIRRIFISHHHNMAQFGAMLSPINRLRGT